MKKLISLLLVFAMALCLSACGGDPTETTPSGTESTPAPEGFTFTSGGAEIAMHADAAPIISALGEPKSYTEETSCAFTGLDKTYYYGGFYLTTYPQGEKDYVFSAWFVDDSVTTAEGIYIGATQAEVEAAYGAENYNGTNAYIVTKGDSKLTVILTDGAVSSIQYDAIVE